MSNNHPNNCPFCGLKFPKDLIDNVYPTGRWREDDGMRHYLLPDDPREHFGRTWNVVCQEHMGGCGASISGDSYDEAIEKWNRRASTALDVKPVFEV